MLKLGRASTRYNTFFIPMRERACAWCALPLSCAHSAARRAPQRPTAFSTPPAATSSAIHSLRPQRASRPPRPHHPARRRRPPPRHCCEQIQLRVRHGGTQDARHSRGWQEGARQPGAGRHVACAHAARDWQFFFFSLLAPLLNKVCLHLRSRNSHL